MGNFFSNWWNALFQTTREIRILIIGFDASGKTSLLYRLATHEEVHTIPTIGFNVEKITFKNLTFTAWDVSGRDKTRALWRHYFVDTDAVVYLIDSNDTERMDDSIEELVKVLREDQLDQAAFLILANKQDLPGALSVSEISQKLHNKDDMKNKRWFIQGCSVIKNEGIDEGFSWLADQLKRTE